MTVAFKIEPFARCVLELAPLFNEAHAELGQFKDRMPLSPDWPRYVELDRLGALFLTTMRRDGELIGYMTTSVSLGLHHSLNKIAVMDISYVQQRHRGRGHFLLMMDFVEARLRDLGVDLWLCHYVKDRPLRFDRVLSTIGFVPTENTMGKWLRNGD